MPKTKKTSAKNQLKQPEQKTKSKISSSSKLLIDVYDGKGRKKDPVEVPEEIFSVKANLRLLAQYVRVYLANQRQGTASTKTRGEVSGSTRKIYRQKGTGRARHGDIKAPIFVGGGIVGGPKPRDYSLKMNKKQRRKSLFFALSLKQKEKAIIQIEKDIWEIEPKTKSGIELLKKTDCFGKKILFVFSEKKNDNLIYALRNIPDVYFSDVKSLNTYMILNAEKIVFIEDALSVLKTHFLKN